jgi:hypothetical protein
MRSFRQIVLVILFLFTGTPWVIAQVTYYVDAKATGAGTGNNWADAFNDIHTAFSIAESGDTIRIAQGTYTPDDSHPTLAIGDRAAYWDYPGDVVVEGGYRGNSGGGDPEDRDSGLFETILSGEIGDPELETDNSWALIKANVRGDILFDGLTLSGVYQDSSSLPQGHYGSVLWTFGSNRVALNDIRIVDNVTINDDQLGRGGALFILNTPGTISNCEFVDNRIGGTQFQTVGGAAFIWDSDITFTDCLFEDNVNDAIGGAAFGGAIYIEHGYPVFQNVIFRNNIAENAGGAVFHRNAWDPVKHPDREGAPTFIDCVFESNASNNGGAAFIWSRREDDVCTFRNCQFLGNTTVQGGAAIYSNGGGLTVMGVNVEGCLFSGNQTAFGSRSVAQHGTAFDGPGAKSRFTNCTIAGNIAGSGLMLSTFPEGDYRIANTIIRNNGSGSLNRFSIHGRIVSSNIEGAALLNPSIVQIDVIDSNAHFVDPAGGDYRLASGSPSIDCGDDSSVPEDLTSDLDGNDRAVDGDNDFVSVVDMGAFESAD